MPSINEFMLDKRLVSRFIKRGELSRENYRAYLESLQDATDKSEPLFLWSDAEEQPAEQQEPME